MFKKRLLKQLTVSAALLTTAVPIAATVAHPFAIVAHAEEQAETATYTSKITVQGASDGKPSPIHVRVENDPNITITSVRINGQEVALTDGSAAYVPEVAGEHTLEIDYSFVKQETETKFTVKVAQEDVEDITTDTSYVDAKYNIIYVMDASGSRFKIIKDVINQTESFINSLNKDNIEVWMENYEGGPYKNTTSSIVMKNNWEAYNYEKLSTIQLMLSNQPSGDVVEGKHTVYKDSIFTNTLYGTNDRLLNVIREIKEKSKLGPDVETLVIFDSDFDDYIGVKGDMGPENKSSSKEYANDTDLSEKLKELNAKIVLMNDDLASGEDTHGSNSPRTLTQLHENVWDVSSQKDDGTQQNREELLKDFFAQAVETKENKTPRAIGEIHNDTVTIPGEKKIVNVPGPKVQYVNKDTGEVLKEEDLPEQPDGSEYDVTLRGKDITIDGKTYRFVGKTDDSAELKGTLTQDGQPVVKFNYEEVHGGVVTRQLVDLDGNILDTEIVTENNPDVGGDYETSAPEQLTSKDGLVFVKVGLKEGSSPEKGKITEEPQQVVYEYDKLLGKGSTVLIKTPEGKELEVIKLQEDGGHVGTKYSYTVNKQDYVDGDGLVYTFKESKDGDVINHFVTELGVQHVVLFEAKKVMVDFEFKLDGEGELPDKVKELLPEALTVQKGSKVNVEPLKNTKVVIGKDAYEFKGWDKSELTASDTNKVVGTWTKTTAVEEPAPIVINETPKQEPVKKSLPSTGATTGIAASILGAATLVGTVLFGKRKK